MNNFHYAGFANNPKNEKNARLLQQLKMIDRELEQDHKKLAERKKLEEEFYEDSNRMNLNLADEVMNELLNKKPQLNAKPINPSIKPQIQYDQMRYFSPLANQMIVPEQNRNFNMPSKPQEIPRAHEIVNKRQLQKMKLQNQNAQQEFPFGGHSREKDRKMRGGYENPTRLSPEKEYPIKNNYVIQQEKPKSSQQNLKVSNPFVKNDEIVRQKREQQQKQYRRLLQEQMEQQKRRKQAEKQKYKEQLKQKFNNYTPAANVGGVVEGFGNQVNVINENAPKKKRDPNAQYTSLEKPASQIRPSDLQYFKMQAQDLKNKMKKGRINFQQYQQQIKKLQAHYKCKVQDFPQLMNQPNRQRVENESLGLQKGNIDVQNNSEKGKVLSSQPYEQLERRQNSSSLTKNRNNLISEGTPYDNANNRYDNYPNTSVPIQSIAQRPQLYPNYSNYHPQGPIQMPNPQADYQMQMMFKLLDQFKNIFKIQTQSYSTDKKVLQEALTKMIPNVNPIMMTQQIPATQLPPQKQFYTQAKKMERFDNFPKNNIQGIDYSAPQSTESEISSSYIQKSMSGIVNKIPLTKKQREEEKGDCNKDMAKFYERKYKVNKFKGFQYQQVDNQSSFVIPSVSNFMQTKNSQNQLSQAFEKDLKNYKRLQKQRQMVIMMQKIKMGKVAQTKSSPKKVAKTQQISLNKQKAALKKQFKQQNIKQKPLTQQNPFLKKHISNDSNYGQQPQMQIRVKQSAQQNIQNFHSPNPKSQILEQQQYQTQPKQRGSPKNKQKPDLKRNQESTYQPQVAKDSTRDHPSSKLMNIMKANNQILAKYQMTPPHNPNPHIGSNSLSSIKEAIRADTSSKELSSREYFSGHEISPVQRRQYQSSLQTVRSQQESAKYQRKNNMDLLVMGSAGSHSNFSSDYHPRNMMSPNSVHASPTIQSIQIERRQEVSRDPRFQQNAPNITGYSQTVESISENSSRLPSFNKPPNNNSRKNGRTVSRKKESVVKLGNSGEGFQKSGLSGIPSQGSRQKSSEREGNDNVSSMQAPKFDSAVYESAYEQSQANLSKIKKVEERKQNQKYPQNLIQFPNAFKQPIYNDSSLSRSKENVYREFNEVRQPITKPAPKLRSLEQARKIAREYKQKAGQEHNRSSVEQKLSQLQSIVQTNKKDESLYKNRREQPQTTNKKKDIMKILDGLEEQDQYEPDFQSYREESEK